MEDISIEKISSFEDLIKISARKREPELKYDLEKNVNLIKFSEGKIDIGYNEKIGKDFVRNLSQKLYEWTKKRWVITLTKGEGQKTYYELQSEKKQKLLEMEKKGKMFEEFKKIFSDIDLIDVTKKD